MKTRGGDGKRQGEHSTPGMLPRFDFEPVHSPTKLTAGTTNSPASHDLFFVDIGVSTYPTPSPNLHIRVQFDPTPSAASTAQSQRFLTSRVLGRISINRSLGSYFSLPSAFHDVEPKNRGAAR